MEKLTKVLILKILDYIPNKFNNKILLKWDSDEITNHVLKERSFPNLVIE